jgi:hypothetical protein
MKGIKNLFEKLKANCLSHNYKVEDVLNSEAINEMLLISQLKPKLLRK